MRMRRSVLLLAALTVAVLLASGVALAVTPEGAGHGSLQGTGGRDATLDHALEELVAMHGGPPGVTPSCSEPRTGRFTASGSVT
jgi:hypothetical protein